MALLRVVALVGALVGSALAQNSSAVFIDTIAGAPATQFDNLPPRETPIVQPQAVWVHPNNDIFVADGNFVVRRIRGDEVTIVAGGGKLIDDAGSVDARDARIDYPSGLVGNSEGELYIADVRHHRVRLLSPDGRITTVVGRGTAGYSGDGGRATAAQLNFPTALALAPDGALFIADTDNHVVRRYDPRTRLITTVAGSGEFGYSGDGGLATKAAIGSVRGLAVDAEGSLYLADIDHFVVRRVSLDGSIDTVAGTGESGDEGDGGPAREAQIGSSYGLAFDDEGNLYISDNTHARVRRVSPVGIITAFAGRWEADNPGAENLPATDVYLDGPAGIAFDRMGNLYIPESGAHLVRKVNGATGIITTIAGTKNPFDGGPALEAPVIQPIAVAVDSSGNLFIADQGNLRIRRVDSRTGQITTVAGDGRRKGTQGATEESLPLGFTFSIDPDGRLLVIDPEFQTLFRLDPGTGRRVELADFSTVTDLILSSAITAEDGTIYFADRGNHIIVRIRPGRDIGIVAGMAREGYDGDGGPAADAFLYQPTGLLLDGEGRLLFCDSGNHVVRVIDLEDETIDAFAGDGYDENGYDGFPAVRASLRRPMGLARNPHSKAVFIADETANEIRMVNADGIISTLAGSGQVGLAGDGGLAILARFDSPIGLAYFEGQLLIGDTYNYRVRRLFVRGIDNVLTVDRERLTFRAEQGESIPPQLLVLNSSFPGATIYFEVSGRTDSGGGWLYVCQLNADSDDECSLDGLTPDTMMISVDTRELEPGHYTATLWLDGTDSPRIEIPVDMFIDSPGESRTVALSTDVVDFTLPQGASGNRLVRVSSRIRAPLAWSARVITDSPWLRLSRLSGQTPASVEFAVDTESLTPDIYFALVSVEGEEGGSELAVVVLKVTEARPTLELDRGAMVFEAVAGTTAAPAQSLHLFNAGSAEMRWELRIPAEARWLHASSLGGVIPPGGAPARTNFTVDVASLEAGVYEARVTVEAAGTAHELAALRSPQTLLVRVRVAPPGTPAGPVFDRTALAFVGLPGQRISDQRISLTSTGGPLTFTSSVRTEGGRWLTVSPASGTVPSSSQGYTLQYQVQTGELTEGVYNGTVTYAFSDGTVREISVTAILRTPGGESDRSRPGRRQSGCSPAQQVIVAPTLSNNFSLTIGWPQVLRVQLYDDCGAPLTSSTVNATFNNGDAPLVLTNLRNGEYTATWTPSSAAESVAVTLRALGADLETAEWQSLGRIRVSEGDGPPVLLAGGVMNAASRRTTSLIAPMERLIVRGANFPSEPSEAFVLINGQPVDVLAASPDELQVIVPAEVADAPSAAILVGARGFYTTPEILTVTDAHPGLYPLPEETVARAGESLTVRATGLGMFDEEGKPHHPIEVSVGDRAAAVEDVTAVEDEAGVYAIRLRIPEGVSGAAGITVLQDKVTSNTVLVRVD